jgi:transcriptional regulator with XRE-family HTH domain
MSAASFLLGDVPLTCRATCVGVRLSSCAALLIFDQRVIVTFLMMIGLFFVIALSPFWCYRFFNSWKYLLSEQGRLYTNLQKRVNTKMQETEISFSSRLKELRGSRTQVAIAKELNVNQQTYARWELGDRQPKLQDLASIALHFGVSTDWLLGTSKAPSEKATASKHPDAKVLHSAVSDNTELYVAECKECKKKAVQIERLERIIDKLTK